MLIGELARRTGTTTRALRFYEQEGLLTSQRTSSGYRRYSEIVVMRVLNIRELLKVGFTVAEIRAFVPFFDECAEENVPYSVGCVLSYDLVGLKRVAAMEEQIAELSAQRERLLRHLTEPRTTPEPSTA
ncbi:MerR family transcriptional regulator [Actinosynnema sp. NPDC020468]|uniref:MerR family transcriptional regulator n=1 Tax=Actinosynnema sp. NPDC020468 TaxID=3154488 RepID=UPI0033EF4849